MKIIEAISSFSSINTEYLRSPSLPTNFLPIPDSKYIILNTQADTPSANYLYFKEALQLCFHHLNENGISVLQLGSNGDKGIPNIPIINTETFDISQISFLVKNSAAYISNNNLFTHFCAAEGTPFLGIYTDANPAKNFAPFHIEGKHKLIEHYKTVRPSYNEHDTSINEIKPETIAQGILDLLNIDFKIEIETLYIGNNYREHIFDLIIDHESQLEEFIIPNLRLDLFYDESLLIQNLEKLKKCSIVTGNPVDDAILQKYKDKIHTIIYRLNKGVNLDFIRKIQKFNYFLTSLLSGEELKKIKYKLLDIDAKDVLPELENKDDIDLTDCFFQSNKKVFSQSGMFLSDFMYKNCLNSNNNVQKCPLNKEFLKEKEFFWIFKNHEKES